MNKKRLMFVVGMLLTLLVVVSAGCNGTGKQKDVITRWKKVRTAVANKDLEAFKTLTIPSKDPEKYSKMTQEDFEEFAEMWLLPFFPEWNTVKLLKFEQNDKKALLVLHLYDDEDDEEWKDSITISPYTFLLTEDGWKWSARLYMNSFPKSESAEENQKNIEEELKSHPDLQLETE